jgi:cell division protein FtsQ
VREQVVRQKVGNRTGMSGQRRSTVVAQKPSRRETGGERSAWRLRSLLGYVPTVLKLALAIVIGVLIFAGYRAAASASFFQVHRVDVQGTSRVPRTEVQTLVRREADTTGVWNADLRGISARLEQLPWVRTATVSRVLPDGLRVRISERVPRAVVRTASGRFRWIDEDAVLLGEMLPTDQIPAFFLRGLNEEDSPNARNENRERVEKFLELERDWNQLGLSERVSEVNLIDIRDVRAQLAGDSSQIEVRLGAQDHGKRLKKALEILDAQRQTPRASLTSYIDMSQGTRAIIGLVSGAHMTGEGSEVSAATGNDETLAENKPGIATAAPVVRVCANNEATTTSQLKNRKEREKKDEAQKKSDKKNSNRNRH